MANLTRRGDRGFGDLRNEIDRLFEDFFSPTMSGTSGRGTGSRLQEFSPKLEVLEREDKYMLRAELPGMKPEDVELNIDNNVLTLSGERRSEDERNERGYHYSECSYGRFSRSIQLPQGTDVSKIQADFKHGVLEVQIPKSEVARPRRINIGGSQRTEGQPLPSGTASAGTSGNLPRNGGENQSGSRRESHPTR
jgi:HSP20 family protein